MGCLGRIAQGFQGGKGVFWVEAMLEALGRGLVEAFEFGAQFLAAFEQAFKRRFKRL